MNHVLAEILGPAPVADAEEEAFIVFSQDIPSHSLGFIDSQAATLEISVAGHELTIHQSRGLLTSDRKAGTTGAVVWKVTPLFASWLSSPTNFLFQNALLTPPSTALELGTGVSGIVALTLAPRLRHYIATDQPYVLKILRQNVAANIDTVLPKGRKGAAKMSKKKQKTDGEVERDKKIEVRSLDWELDDISTFGDVDLLIACDCIYNESLIEPLNATCEAICRLRRSRTWAQDQSQGQSQSPETESTNPTICLIAQQLRSPDVFEAWLRSFSEKFWVWRVPDRLLDEGLREGKGFVVHVGVVR